VGYLAAQRPSRLHVLSLDGRFPQTNSVPPEKTMLARYVEGMWAKYCEALSTVNKGDTVMLSTSLTLLIGLSDRQARISPQASGALGKSMVRRKDSRQ
jgi:hypothetical protein